MMKPRNLRDKALAFGAGLVLILLGATGLFGDEAKSQSHRDGRGAASQRQSSGEKQQGGGGGHAQGQNQSGGGRTYTPPQGNNSQGNNQDGGRKFGGDNNSGRRYGRPGDNTGQPTHVRENHGNRTPDAAGNNPGQRNANPDGYNRGNRPSYNPGNQPTYNPPNRNSENSGYNPRNRDSNNNPGNRNSNNSGYNPGNRNPNNNGYNPGNRNSNSGGYNGGGNNAGGYNARAWRPPQGATASPNANGGRSYTHGNAQYRTDNSGRLTHYSRPGTEARFGSNGNVSYAHFSRPDRSTVIVNRGPRGERTVITMRADRTRVVSYGPRYGYVERPLAARPGYISRTYIYAGRPYVRVYHTYGWRGVTYYRYVPPLYYHPVFYGWVYNPWVTPVYFRWGWYRDPWYGYWGGYFAPAPVYPTAALWLTDYLLAENLRLAYESRQAQLQQEQEAPPPQYPQNGGVTLTPEIKAAIAEEVRQQIDAERAAAAAGQSGSAQPGGYSGNSGGYPGTAPASGEVPPPSLDPRQRIFVISSNMDVTAAGGESCALTPGDIILRTGDQMTADGQIGVSVLSSKPGDCVVNSAANIEVATLQEMHNQFREQIGNGMKMLAENQGKNGLPSGPAANPRTAAEGQAQAESADSVEDALKRQLSDANQAEAEIQQATNTRQ